MVTIRCLTYNQELYVRECLEGLVTQKTNFRFEAIVHDDASTDGTAAIIREYAEKYPDIIKPIYETENQYSKKNGSIRRIMDSHTHGKYVAFCEGDDYWTDPLKLQKQVDVLEKNENAMMVYTGFKTIDSDGKEMKRMKYEVMKSQSFSGDVFPKLLERGNFILTLTTCFRRKVFDTDLLKEMPSGLDYGLFLAASSMGDAIYIPDETACYRYVGNSEMNSNLASVQNRYLSIKKYVVYAFLDKRTIHRSFLMRISIYIGILSNAVSLHKSRTDRLYLKSILNKKRSLYLLMPLAVLLLAINRIRK